jgi:protein-disulfide isomerase
MAPYAWLGSLRRVLWLPLLVMPLLLLAACDGAEAQPEPAAPTTAVTAPATQPTAAPPAPTAAGPSEAQTGTPYNGVAQGLTPEGFPFLGAANAPVTLTEHSDFQ